MLPKDSRDINVQIKISGFEEALENALAGNTIIFNEFWRVDKEYRVCKLSLVDALERSCLILMTESSLLEAFCEIPRRGYVFWTAFDTNIDLWLLINVADGETIRRRLGGGIGPHSGECLLHLPHYAEASDNIFDSILRERPTSPGPDGGACVSLTTDWERPASPGTHFESPAPPGSDP